MQLLRRECDEPSSELLSSGGSWFNVVFASANKESGYLPGIL